MATPEWKIYDASGTYQAACKEAEAAACLVALYGVGAKIKHDHGLVVWHEGHESMSAALSYDGAAKTMFARRAAYARKMIDKNYGPGTADKWDAERAAKRSPA